MAKQPQEPRYNRTIAVPASVMEPAKRLANDEDISLNELIVQAIKEYVQSHQPPERRKAS